MTTCTNLSYDLMLPEGSAIGNQRTGTAMGESPPMSRGAAGCEPAPRLERNRKRLERTARPCRPPLLTHVCKRGGRPPSAFRLLPCVSPPGACSPARVLIERDSLF